MPDLTSKTGRASAVIKAGVTGEVIIDGQHYLAHPYLSTDEIPPNAKVMVMEYEAPRTVYVTQIA